MGSFKEQAQLPWVQLRGRSQLSWAQLHFVFYSPYIFRCKKSLNDLSYLSLINAYVRDTYLLLNAIRKNDTSAPSLYKRTRLGSYQYQMDPSSSRFTISSFIIFLAYIFSKYISLKYYCTFSL
jgi:hypothetical protein